MGAFCVFGWTAEDLKEIEDLTAARVELWGKKKLKSAEIEHKKSAFAQSQMSRRKKIMSPEFDHPAACSDFIELLKKHVKDMTVFQIMFRGIDRGGFSQRRWVKCEWQQKATQQSLVKAVGKSLAAHA